MYGKRYANSYAIYAAATGRRIRDYRIRNGLSVSELSELFGGLSRNSIYKWERGDTLPSLDNLYSLAGLFDVSLDELVVGNRGSQSCDDDDQPSSVVMIYKGMCHWVHSFFIHQNTERCQDLRS